MRKILVVLTSNAVLGDSGKPTGFWLSELTHFYDVVSLAGFTIDVISPTGGKAPMDPKSYDLSDKSNKAFMQNPVLVEKIENTLRPEDVDAAEYVAIFYPGGHGPMWDLPKEARIASLAQEIYTQGGIVAAVCHGPAGLLAIADENGDPLIKDKTVTGLSNLEERLVRKHKIVPFLLEDELKNKGAVYTKTLPGLSHVEVSGRVVTGQNPRSTKKMAHEVVKLLQGVMG